MGILRQPGLQKKEGNGMMMVAHTFNPSRGRGISEFEICLVYRVSSGKARVTQRNPVSENKKQKQTNKDLQDPALRLYNE